MMLTAGESPLWVAQQMGHSDTSMIFRNYARWIETENAKSGEKALAMFSEHKDTGSIPPQLSEVASLLATVKKIILSLSWQLHGSLLQHPL
jgi:hypothetical protein